jgi:methionine-rich copper-binding protein CopC
MSVHVWKRSMGRRTVVLAFVLVAATTTVFAHMKASKFEPAAGSTVTTSPPRVQVWFTQAPDPKVSRLDVSGSAGAVKLQAFRVTAEKSIIATVEGTLANGRYIARWQAAGDDGHIQKGEFAFTVQRAN